jgi:hypothetical protein
MTIPSCVYVLRDRSFEQLDFLGKITEVGPQLLSVPHLDLGIVEADFSGVRWQGADDQSRQRRLARPAGAEDGQNVARGQAKINSPQRRLRAAGQPGDDLLEAERTARHGQGDPFLLRRRSAKQRVQSGIRAAHRYALLPRADSLLQRGERTCHQHRCGSDHSRRDLIVDHQQSAATQQDYLQQEPNRFGHAGAQAGPTCGFCLQLQAFVPLPEPTLLQVGQHAHRFQRLRVAQTPFHETVGVSGFATRNLEIRTSREMVHQSDPQEDSGTAQGDEAE